MTLGQTSGDNFETLCQIADTFEVDPNVNAIHSVLEPIRKAIADLDSGARNFFLNMNPEHECDIPKFSDMEKRADTAQQGHAYDSLNARLEDHQILSVLFWLQEVREKLIPVVTETRAQRNAMKAGVIQPIPSSAVTEPVSELAAVA